MLNIGSIKSSGGTADYHTSPESQLENEEFQGTEWLGEGAALLGLEGEAAPEDIKAVLDGNPPEKTAELENEATGDAKADDSPAEEANAEEKADQNPASEQPGQEAPTQESDKVGQGGLEELPDVPAAPADREHTSTGGVEADKAGGGEASPTGDNQRTRLGDELIFSAPKSVSILAVTHGDKRLVEAWRDSVEASLSYIEKNYAQAQIRENGEVRSEKTGNLVMTRVTHGYDDAGRPHLHDHMTIANMTQTADGKWRAFDNRALWQDSALMGSMQMQDFANRIRPLGYEIRHNDDVRGWDIASVPRDVTLANAPRGEEIKAEAADKGRGGYGAELIARYDTRTNTGKDFDAKLLNERNRNDDKAMGFDGNKVVADAQQNAGKAAPAESVAGKLRQTITQSFKDTIDKHDAVKDAKLANSPYLPGNIRSMTQSPVEMRAAVELASAIAHKEQFQAAFKERDVMRTALDQTVQGVTLTMLNARMDELKEQGLIVPGVPAHDGTRSPYITTKDAIATEQKIISNIENERDQSKPFIAAEKVEAALEPHLKVDGKTGEVMTLKPEQMNAAKLILASKDGYVNIQGFSGTGKTTLLGPVFDALKEQGNKVMGIGPSVQSRNEMQSVGADAVTTAKFLKEFEYAQTNPQKMQEMRAEYKGSMLVTDEASFTGNKDMLAITEAKAALGIEKVVTVGDKGQKQSVLAGKAFEVVQTIKTAYAEIRDVVRHSNSAIKGYNEHIREGRVKEAFNEIRESFVVKDDYLKSAVDSYLGRSGEERDKYYLISVGNKDRETMNAMVQDARLQAGEINGPAIVHTIHEQKTLSDQQLRQSRYYVPGNTLEVHVNSRSLGLKRGEYSVEDRKGNQVFVSDSNGKMHKFDPRKYEGSNVSRLGNQARSESISLSSVKEITLYEGDKIRFNRNLDSEKIVNGDVATIKSHDEKGITYSMADGRDVVLEHSNSQNQKLTEGYALNVDKVQGGSKLGAIMAAGSTSPLEASMRDLYVGPTRAISVLEIHTDSVESLEVSALKNNRDEKAATEITGQLDQRILKDMADDFKALFPDDSNKNEPDKKDDTDWRKGENSDPLNNTNDITKTLGETELKPNEANPLNAAAIATRMSIQDDFGKSGNEFLSEIAAKSIQYGSIDDQKPPSIKTGSEIAAAGNAEEAQVTADNNSANIGEGSTPNKEPEIQLPELEITRDFDIS
jgi:conjugative relaxase-like TrwC/TraI family protein